MLLPNPVHPVYRLMLSLQQVKLVAKPIRHYC